MAPRNIPPKVDRITSTCVGLWPLISNLSSVSIGFGPIAPPSAQAPISAKKLSGADIRTAVATMAIVITR